MRRAFVIMVATLALACSRAQEPVEPGPAPQHAEAGDTVTLRYGEVVRLGENLRFVFRAVLEDSRCPINVLCVWAGDAVVRVDALRADGPPQILQLHTNGEPRSGRFDEYLLELIEVAPARVAPDSLKPSDYSIRVAISRG